MYKFSTYKDQYRANLKLALPIILTQVGQIMVQIADNIMVGRYGGDDPLPLAASAFGSSSFFIIFIAAIGVTFGLTPIVGENYAKGNIKESAHYLHNGVIFYTILGVAFTALQIAIEPLLYHAGQPVEVVNMALPYYRMLAWSMTPVMIFFTFKQFMEGVGNTKIEMVVVILSNLFNIMVNYIYIYGNFGAPELGIVGAGIGTLVSRIIMPIMMIGYLFYRRDYRIYLQNFAFKHFSWQRIKRLIAVGFPISSQVFLESSAFIFTAIMMGWIGTNVISANQIATAVCNAAFMIVMSISIATTILVSHSYGVRNLKQLVIAAKASYHLGLVWNFAAATIFITCRKIIPLAFTSNPEVIEITSNLFIFAALFQLSDGVQNISIGILRGIQDVKIIPFIAFISYIVINLPLGYLFCFTWGMQQNGLFLGFSFGLSVAAVLMILRIRSKIRTFSREW